MGMFDYVHFEMDCPKCGTPVKGFQSKDFICNLETIEPDALQNFYASCRKCEAWIEFSRPRPEGAPLREKSLTLAEIAAMGFEMEVTLNVTPNVQIEGQAASGLSRSNVGFDTDTTE